MPKTYNDLWSEVVSWDNLYRAYLGARKRKRLTPEALIFAENLEENLINLQNHLIWKTWKPGKWRQFYERYPKVRLIQAPPFEDRVAHHALVDVVEPLFERKMIFHSYACRKNKGSHAAPLMLQKMLRQAQREWGNVYVLQCDIAKYFPSIGHDRLMWIIARTIRDRSVLWMFDTVIRFGGTGDGHGLPVGALSSQLEANIYMDQADHKIKDDWGVKHYIRYMDDFVILGRTSREMHELRESLEQYLASYLGLSLNPKTSVYKSSQGIDFAGYRVWSTHILPRKRNIKQARIRFRAMSKAYAAGKIGLDYVRPRVSSFLGYTKHCTCKRTTESALGDLVLIRGT